MQKIIHSDCLDAMKEMEDNSIDFIVTDPPYGFKFMNKKWDYQVPSVNCWKEALRIVKPGSWIAVFGGTRTYHRMVLNVEDAGFEIRDCINWIYGSGFPKSHNKFGLDGYGTALKPAHELILLAMKPLDGTFAQNAEKWGVAGINIDASRIHLNDYDKNEYIPNRVGYKNGIDHSQISDGEKSNVTYGNRDTSGQIFNKSGRWPANLILNEESAEQLDKMTGVLKSGAGNRRPNGGGEMFNGFGKMEANFPASSGGASRFFKCIDSECFLCYNPCTKAKEKECNHIHAEHAELSSKNICQIKENIVPENALVKQNVQFVQNVKSAGNLCDLCAMNIVQHLVEIKNLDSKIEGLPAILGYITNFKKCILIQNLVLFAEQWENIDTIPTIESLSKLFGCVHHAIESYTKQENHNPNGKNEQSRFLYCPKASSSERNKGLEGMPLKENMRVNAPRLNEESKLSNKTQNHHPTVKPIALMKYIIKLLAPPGSPILLDPFCGSGSTLLAAKQLGISCIGIEKEQEYCEIAQKRVDM